MNKDVIKKVAIIFIMVLFFGTFLGTLMHELLGHGMTAVLFGGEITKVCVLFFEANSQGLLLNYCGKAYGFIFGYVTYNLENINMLSGGFTTIMGSVFTFIISLIFSFIILLKKKFSGYSKYILTIFSLYFLDIIYNFSKLYRGEKGDFLKIVTVTKISLTPLLLIVLLGAITTTTLLFYKLKDKKMERKLKITFILLLSLTLASLVAFLIYFGFRMHGL
jgi:hypothetical protein